MSSAEVTSDDELDAVTGTPLPHVAAKVRRSLHPADVVRIGRTSLCLIARSDTSGACDVSP